MPGNPADGDMSSGGDFGHLAASRPDRATEEGSEVRDDPLFHSQQERDDWENFDPNAEPTSDLDQYAVWRTGRKVGRTIYRQTGEEPSDSDRLIGVMDTPEWAALVVEAVNGEIGDIRR